MELLAPVPVIDQLVRAALAHAGTPVSIIRPRPATAKEPFGAVTRTGHNQADLRVSPAAERTSAGPDPGIPGRVPASQIAPARCAPAACRAQISWPSAPGPAGTRYRHLVLGTGWTEAVALVAAYSSRCCRPLRASPARSCCCHSRSASWARPARRSPRPTCYTTWSQHRERCTGTGGRGRPAAVSPWCSSPGPCPASSPDRSSASSCCPALASSTWWSPPSCFRSGSGSP